MKITALEIRQKAFDKEFRGYKKDEVDAFLLALSQAWEKMVGDNKELKLRLEHAEKEVQKLREVEDSLFKTLKTAETTGASMVEQANKSAELLMRETKLKAEQLYNDAQNKSDLVISRMQNEIRELEQDYRAIENQRDSMIREIKSLAGDTLERVNKVSLDKKDLTAIRERAQNIGAELRKEPLRNFETPSIEVPKSEPTPIVVADPIPAPTPKVEKEVEKEVEPVKAEVIEPVVEEEIIESAAEVLKTEEPQPKVEVEKEIEVEAEPEIEAKIEVEEEETKDDTPHIDASTELEEEEEIVEPEPESEPIEEVENKEEVRVKKEETKAPPPPAPSKEAGTTRSFFDEIAD